MSAITFLDSVDATGASSIKQLPFLVQTHTVQATIFGSGANAVTISLEGSIDGTTFFDLGTHAFTAGELTALGAMFHIVDRPVSYVRANLTVLGVDAETDPLITVKYDGDSVPTGIKNTGRRGQF
jgi:hypothetical protein